MSNSWVAKIRDWGQSAIDDSAIMLDRGETRGELFEAVLESLVPKENTVSPDIRDYAELAGEKLVLVPLSGGLDSLVAYHRSADLGYDTRAYFIKLNTPYANLEHAAVESLGVEYELIDSGDWPARWKPYETRWQHILPLRNLLIIASVAEAASDRPGEIWLGATEGEIPPNKGDKSLKFFTATDKILATYPIKHSLKFPLRYETKTDLVAWWALSGRDTDELKKTITCQSGTRVPCGKCHACFNRWVAMTNNGINEDLLTDPRSVETNAIKVQAFKEALKIKDFDTWSERRILQTLSAWYGEAWPDEFPPSVYDRLVDMGLL